MAHAIESPPLAMEAPLSLAGLRGRALERRLLLWNAPLVLLAAWGLAAAQRQPGEHFVPALVALATVWAACIALHVVLCLTGFDGDPLMLPLVSLLFLVGAAYHLDLRSAHAGPPSNLYIRGVLLSLGVLVAVTPGGRYFKRLSLLFEEKVWWRVAGDRPYYDSFPF